MAVRWEPHRYAPASRRPWIVCKNRTQGASHPIYNFHTDSRGRLIRYTTREAAQEAAERLNGTNQGS